MNDVVRDVSRAIVGTVEGALEPHAAPRQAVEVRRLRGGRGAGAHRINAMVVGDDDDQVGQAPSGAEAREGGGGGAEGAE